MAKGILVVRQKNALKRLEAAYEKFKAAGEDKKPYTSTRNGKTIYHKDRSYADECKRMSNEIAALKAHISRNNKS